MNEAESGGAYADRLLHEHARLNQRLIGISHEVAKLGQAGQPRVSFVELAQSLIDLRQQLQAHFAEEEAGGCLEEAVTRSPSLGVDSKAILAEHLLLNRMLEHLVAQAHNPAVPPADVQREFRAFADKLHAHEAAENRLLQVAFGAEVADYDVEGVD